MIRNNPFEKCDGCGKKFRIDDLSPHPDDKSTEEFCHSCWSDLEKKEAKDDR